MQAESAALEGHITTILESSAANGVPVVFALSRKRLGEVWGSRKRMSVVAVLSAEGAEDLLARSLALAAEGRRRWEAAQRTAGGLGPSPGAPAGVGAVPTQHAAGGAQAPAPGPPAAAPAATAPAAAPAAEQAPAVCEDENDDDALL